METLKTLPLTIEELLEVVNQTGSFISSCILCGLSECDNCNCHECEVAAADHDAIIAVGYIPVLSRNKEPDGLTKSLFTLGRSPEGEFIEINHEGDLEGNIYISSHGARRTSDESGT